MRVFTAVLYREEGVYVAECPEVGTVSQGKEFEEAVANLKEATELYLEEAPYLRHGARAPVAGCTDFPLEDGRGPIITTFELSEVSPGPDSVGHPSTSNSFRISSSE